MNKKEKIEHITSCGNVFADLGLKDADELFTRGLLGIEVIRILKQRGLKEHTDAAVFLDIDQSEASQLLNAEFNYFSEGRLMSFLNKLNYKVKMEISPLQEGEKPQQVIVV